MKYALVDWTNGVRVRRANEIPNGGVTGHPVLKWVPEVEVIPAEYDEELHVKTRQGRGSLVGDEWQIVYTIREKTLREKQSVIRSQYDEIKSQGFEFNGVRFPFKISDYTAAFVVKEGLTYPYPVEATDGTFYDVADAESLAALYFTGAAAYEATDKAMKAELRSME